MMKKILFIFLACMIVTTVISAQSLEVKPYGISARFVEEDATDIFDLKYNGSKNVGVGTKIYLAGMAVDTTFTNPSWTRKAYPTGSVATIIASQDMGETTKIISFIPDVAGTYELEFTDGGLAASITINAGLYLGTPTTGNTCGTCHQETQAKWEGTGHANTVQPYTDDPAGHFQEFCLGCHTTGYDVNAENAGFDDFAFVFPATLQEGNYDALVTAYPNAMQRANVQCEACHGPGSAHNGAVTDSKMVSEQSSSVCSNCHDAGTHHPTGAQFAASGVDATEFDGRGFHGGHTIGAFVDYAGGRAACAPCHSGAGYVQWIKEGRPVNDLGLPTATAVLAEATNFTCVTCHDPHDATKPHQLRASETVLGDGTPISFDLYGTGAQCIDCHRSRRQASTYASDVNSQSSHFGAHHGPQGDMLLGKNAPDFGIMFPTSPHDVAGGNACVDCHMAGESGVDAEGNVLNFGGHTFNMNNEEGEDNVEACADCHGDVGETFMEKKYYWNGDADLDGNGTAEGLQVEVKGLLEELATYLPKIDGEVSITLAADSNLTPSKIRAGYVYMFVLEDRSFGIHNPAFTVSMLKVAIESMKYGDNFASAIQSVTDIPMDQGFQVRLVWTKFNPDAGNYYDKIDSYTILREVMMPAAPPAAIVNYSAIDQITEAKVGSKFMLENKLWDVVAEVPAIRYTEYAAVVPTLHNGVETTFKVLGKTMSGIVAETEPMSGMSIDNLAPAPPANLIAAGMETGIELTWNKSLDKDFNYFEIYRSESQGFTPEAGNLIASLTDVMYLDNTAGTVKYYYVVAAVDISGNKSEFSNEVSATVTDVQLEDAIPTEYALKQNYPNPFNPTTMIKFGIPEASHVKLAIFDVTGREVELLVSENMAAGTYSVDWNAVNLSTGIYFYRIEAGSFVDVKKMILIK